jgi:hypothetical protein
MKIATCFAAECDARSSRDAQAMRAWTTEIVEGECASVTSRVRASNPVGKRGWDGTRDRDGTRCFIERFPANLDIAPLDCRLS